MDFEVVMGQNECTGSKVSENLYLNRVSAHLQTCKMTEIKLKSVICMHTFFIYLCFLLYNLPVIRGTVFQASRSYILNMVFF